MGVELQARDGMRVRPREVLDDLACCNVKDLQAGGQVVTMQMWALMCRQQEACMEVSGHLSLAPNAASLSFTAATLP